jgi:uncharacterized protein
LLNHNTIAFPLLESIKRICDKANVTFYCFFITNATLLSEEVLLNLKKFNPLFQITLDGNREKHNKVRAFKKSHNGSFDAIINAFKLISEHIQLVNTSTINVATIRINYDNATLILCQRSNRFLDIHNPHNFFSLKRDRFKVLLFSKQSFFLSWNLNNPVS